MINKKVLLERINEATTASESASGDEMACLVVAQIGHLAKAVLYLAEVVESSGEVNSGFIVAAISGLQKEIAGLK